MAEAGIFRVNSVIFRIDLLQLFGSNHLSEPKRHYGCRFGSFFYANLLSFWSSLSEGLSKGTNSGTRGFGTVWFSHSESRRNQISVVHWSDVRSVESESPSCIGVVFVCLRISKRETSDVDDNYNAGNNLCSSFSSAVVIGGVVVSQIGLWVCNIGVAQLHQNTIDPAMRGTVDGTQSILCHVCLANGISERACTDPHQTSLACILERSSQQVVARLI